VAICCSTYGTGTFPANTQARTPTASSPYVRWLWADEKRDVDFLWDCLCGALR
jgi:hypothetical protein